MIRLLDSDLVVETRTTRAVFEGIRLVSLQEAASGEEFLDRGLQVGLPGFELLFKGLARGIGYHYGGGAGLAQQNRRPMIDANLKQGAIPTLIFSTADPVQELLGEEAQYILERALS